MSRTNSDLQEIVAQALAAMKAEEGSEFDIHHVNHRQSVVFPFQKSFLSEYILPHVCLFQSWH